METQILPMVMPEAMMNEFISWRPRWPLSQAVLMFTQNWSPGISGMGTWETASRGSVAATKV